ncbi:chromate efflux transporter [Nisaea acidiphila]|uniref:Chromate efflux transporter n=1 Tax=Nisaea acidiphila TaxID=1862145 RepID=A0A9J7AW58_9PROT|nr:chromate efflux transporter [Nisaea acidiphila]UUX51034.1 chromate efflux transporter [Nisaea acidiphila]
MSAGETTERRSWVEILLVFLRLGCTSFGGPVAHIGYFREEFVNRRKWLDDRAYADLVALCQFLPGPASSQVGFSIGLTQGGPLGALAAWAGFTLPSAILLAAFAYGVDIAGGAEGAGWLHGLKLVAVAVVAQAALQMGRSLCPDAPRATLAVLAAAFMLVAAPAYGQLLVILAGGIFGLLALKQDEAGETPAAYETRVGPRTALVLLVLFVLLLVGLPLIVAGTDNLGIRIADTFYRVGALVFGGGHVVLPLLEAEIVPQGLVDRDTFLAGYGMAQAIPGPLFTFAAYLGAAAAPEGSEIAVAATALVAIFGSTFLLVPAALPFWAKLRANRRAQSALGGVNAAVVGLILAALYDPVFTGAVAAPVDFALVALAYLALAIWKLPPWFVVLLGAIAGWLLHFSGV